MKNFFVTALAAAVGFTVVYVVIYAFDSMKEKKSTTATAPSAPAATTNK